MNDTNQEYATSEFPLAAALLCMQIKLVDLRPSKEGAGRIEFIFGKDEVIEKFISGYWAGNLRVEPKEFWNHTRELKSRIKAQA